MSSRTALCRLLRVVPLALRVSNGRIQPVAGQSRCYTLSKHATGMKAWERARENSSEDTSLDELCSSVLAELEQGRCSKISNMNKIYDLCMTPEDLAKAERVLISFRKGAHLPRHSLPITIMRACLRADRPRRMLHYTRNQVEFGIFPSKRVFNILINALLTSGDTRRALAAFDHLISEELTPDGMTYHLATKASLFHSLEAIKKDEETGAKNEVKNEEQTEVAEPVELELDRTLEYWEKCRQLEPKLATKTMRFIVNTLLAHGQETKAHELLDQIQAENMVPKQSQLNMKIDAAVSTGDYRGAIETLNELCSSGGEEWSEVGAPKAGLPRLQGAIEEIGDDQLKSLLAEVVEKLKDCGRLENETTTDTNGINSEPVSHSDNPNPSSSHSQTQ